MDFIEQLFGLSPDNGDGTTEMLWIAILVVGVASVAWFRHQRRKANKG